MDKKIFNKYKDCYFYYFKEKNVSFMKAMEALNDGYPILSDGDMLFKYDGKFICYNENWISECSITDFDLNSNEYFIMKKELGEALIFLHIQYMINYSHKEIDILADGLTDEQIKEVREKTKERLKAYQNKKEIGEKQSGTH